MSFLKLYYDGNSSVLNYTELIGNKSSKQAVFVLNLIFVAQSESSIIRYSVLKPNYFAILAAYKHADGKKIDGRRILVDVERGRTVKSWRPRRLGNCFYFDVLCKWNLLL